jgi:hypothetical protein
LTWKTLAIRLAPELNLSLPNICDVSLMTCVWPQGESLSSFCASFSDHSA